MVPELEKQFCILQKMFFDFEIVNFKISVALKNEES